MADKILGTSVESELRLRLRAGLMGGVRYRSIFRPVGSCQAVVEIWGEKFTIDDSSRLTKQAGMVLHGGRGDSRLKGAKTEGDVCKYFAKFSKLTCDDFK